MEKESLWFSSLSKLAPCCEEGAGAEHRASLGSVPSAALHPLPPPSLSTVLVSPRVGGPSAGEC